MGGPETVLRLQTADERRLVRLANGVSRKEPSFGTGAVRRRRSKPGNFVPR